MCRKVTIRWKGPSGAEHTKQYDVPDGLGWCPVCCPMDPEKNLLWKRHVCKELFKDTCVLLLASKHGQEYNGQKLAHNLPKTPQELDVLYDKLALTNIKLRREIQEELVAKAERWMSVQVNAPWMSKGKKRALKKRLERTSNLIDACSTTKKFAGDAVDVDVKQSDKTLCITIKQLGNVDECQVCFCAPVARRPACGVCKHPYSCPACEIEAKRVYGRCPFCNTPC